MFAKKGKVALDILAHSHQTVSFVSTCHGSLKNSGSPLFTDLILEINILENSCCIINLIIISKLVLGPGKNLALSRH